MVAWKLTWTQYSLSLVPCTMLLIGVQAWCRWKSLKTQITPHLVLPHTVIQCTTRFVLTQCMSLLPAVCRPISGPFMFPEGSVFQIALKMALFICLPVLDLRVGRLLPSRLLWRFCSHSCQGQAPGTRGFLPKMLFVPSWYLWIWSWVAQLLYQEVSMPWLLALFSRWLLQVQKRNSFLLCCVKLNYLWILIISLYVDIVVKLKANWLEILQPFYNLPWSPY